MFCKQVHKLLMFIVIAAMTMAEVGLSYAATPAAPLSAEQELIKNGYYVVKTNETLYSIAWEFGLDYRVIAAMNNLAAPYNLKPGQHLMMVESNHTAPEGLGNPPIIVKHLPSNMSNNPPVKSAVAATSQLTWLWPTAGKVTKPYSLNSQTLNKGIDINGKLGQTVIASAGGEVVYSGSGIPGYGNLIILKHNDQYLTAYANNKQNLVKEGQMVKSAQPIALMGQNTSHQTLLHFEIRYDGKPVNPLNYLPKVA